MSVQQQPLVSVIMPAYNSGLFIAEAIDSVLGQTYSNFELIIVDDGSTDDTVSQVQRRSDSRIHLLQTQHLGYASQVRNIGLKHCQGDYIAFLDSDDIYEPDAIESLIQYLLQNPDCGAVHGFNKTIDKDGHRLKLSWTKIVGYDEREQIKLHAQYEHSLEAFLSRFKYCHLQALMISRETLNEVGFFPDFLLTEEDYYFYLKLFNLKNGRFGYIEKFIFSYRFYDTSVTKNPGRLVSHLQSLPKMVELFYECFNFELGIQRSKSSIAMAYYRRYMILRLNEDDYGSFFRIIRHAYREKQLTKPDLLYRIGIELLRHMRKKYLNLRLGFKLGRGEQLARA